MSETESLEHYHDLACDLLWGLPEERRLKLLVMAVMLCHQNQAISSTEAICGLLERLADTTDMPTHAKLAELMRAAADRIYCRARVVN